MKCSAEQYSAMKCSAVGGRAVQCSTVMDVCPSDSSLLPHISGLGFTSTFLYLKEKKAYYNIFNRPGVAGAVLQSPPSLFH